MRSPNNGGRRSRNRSGRRQQQPNRNTVFESNGPDAKVRGTAAQVYEKYVALARDASSAGDYIRFEGLMQHAEHYLRIVNSQRPAERPQNPARDGFEDDGYNDPSEQPQPGSDSDSDEEETMGSAAERSDRGDESRSDGRAEGRAEGQRAIGPSQGNAAQQRDSQQRDQNPVGKQASNEERRERKPRRRREPRVFEPAGGLDPSESEQPVIELISEEPREESQAETRGASQDQYGDQAA